MGRPPGCRVRADRGPAAQRERIAGGRAGPCTGLAIIVALVVSLLAAAPVEAQPEGALPRGDLAVAVDDPGPEQALTQRIAVWRLDALGMDAELVARLETLFRMELDRLAAQPLPTRREIDRAIAGSRELRECSGDDRCLVQIGKKIGVDVVVTGSVAALGDSYTLNIKAVEVGSGKQLRRIATDPLRGSPDELIEAVRVAAYRLLAPNQLHGSVIVLSDLVGATVSLDGKVVGKTPLPAPVAKLALGRHALHVEADGYLPFDDTLDVRFQKSTRVVVRLAARGGDGQPVSALPQPRDRRADGPWYTSPWGYVAVGAAAVLVGATVGWALGDDDVTDCSGSAPSGACP
jgi:hypothetical protein